MRSKKEIMEIMDIFNQRDPNPRCELDYQNAYTLLVAVVLSAQATDKGVNKATKALFAAAEVKPVRNAHDMRVDGQRRFAEPDV